MGTKRRTLAVTNSYDINNVLLLGINASQKKNGEELRDGSACAIQIKHGRLKHITAIQEERLSRRRFDPGSKQAVKYSLSASSMMDNDEIVVGFSSALDKKWTELDAKNFIEHEYGLKKIKRIFVIGHHDSHAYEAFATSPFERAIIIVIDSMGNRLNPYLYGQNAWETQTYYIGQRLSTGQIKLKVIMRECTKTPGYGQLFRAVTRYIGFPGYHHASKVMAISGIGKSQPSRKFPLPHCFENNELNLNIELDPNDLYNPIKKWLSNCGYHDHPPRNEDWYCSENYTNNGRKSLRPLDIELALAVQVGYEEFLIERVRRLVADTGIHDICLGGGVALNCVANSRLLAKKVCNNVYVGSAPSDSGQGLGNALSVLNKTAPNLISSIRPPYLGIQYDEPRVIHTFDLFKKLPIKKGDLSQFIATELSLGKIIAIFLNKSEYGPRALGNRSILASPDFLTFPQILGKLRTIKRREDYQPFAISIVNDERCKVTSHLKSSPYMSFAPVLNKELASIFSSVLHDDGTCRIQTVSKSQNAFYFNILWGFYCITGIPGLVNTSLNLRGEPIVESPEDVISLWDKEPLIDGLIINDYYLSR